jgi:hypothetical protein
MVRDMTQFGATSFAVGDINGTGSEELAVAGFRQVNGQMRAGIFTVDPSNWSVKNTYLLNTNDSNTLTPVDLKLADFNKDGKLNFLLVQQPIFNDDDPGGINMSDALLTMINNNGTIMHQRSYDEGNYKGVSVNDISDINNDGIPLIGTYNYNTQRIEYLNSSLNTVYAVNSTMPVWKAISVTGDPKKEIAFFSNPNSNPNYGGLDVVLDLAKVNGQISKIDLAGIPATPDINFYLNNGAVNLLISTSDPEQSLLQRFIFAMSTTGSWLVDNHDYRRTNNYNSVN